MSTQTSTHENARLFARHTLNMTTEESLVYADGFSDRVEGWSNTGQKRGELRYAYRAGWEDASNAEAS